MEVLQRFILAHEIVTDTHAVAAGFTTRLWPITEKFPTRLFERNAAQGFLTYRIVPVQRIA
jgi:hypothetical protein